MQNLSCIIAYTNFLCMHIMYTYTYLCEGVEKNNDDAKKLYFRQSNRWNATQDILEKQYKTDALECHSRKRRSYR